MHILKDMSTSEIEAFLEQRKLAEQELLKSELNKRNQELTDQYSDWKYAITYNSKYRDIQIFKLGKIEITNHYNDKHQYFKIKFDERFHMKGLGGHYYVHQDLNKLDRLLVVEHSLVQLTEEQYKKYRQMLIDYDDMLRAEPPVFTELANLFNK